MLKILCLILLIIIEIPFAIKFVKAYKAFEIIRQTAIILIMIINVLIIFGLYKLITFVIG